MDVHRLRRVLELLIDEHKRLGIEDRFTQISQTLGACMTNPSVPSDEEFRMALESLLEVLRGSRINDAVESNRRMMDGIDAGRFSGDGLAEQVRALAEKQPFLPARAREGFATLADGLRGYFGALEAAQASLERLNVEPARLSPDEYELGILLPRSVVVGDMDRLAEELTEWNQTLKEVFPLITTKPAQVFVRLVNSRSFELAAPIDREGGLALAKLLAGLYDMFRKVGANRDRATELRAKGYPAEIVGQVEEYEQQIIAQDMAAFKEQLMVNRRQYKGSRKELEKLVERCLTTIADKVRAGVQLEVLGPMAAAEVDAEEEEPGRGDDSLRAVPHHVRAALRHAWRTHETPPAEPSRPPEPRDLPQAVDADHNEPQDRAA